jgi:Lrp/AsnC family transcriptional regulator, leucine-responsive regulatory protein
MPKQTAQTTEVALDKKDLELLKLIQSDAKLTVRDLAARIHLSATPTHDRIKYLEESGVIRQYVALLNYRLLGKKILVICNVSLKEHDKKTAQLFINSVRSFKEVIECYNVSGEFDFMLKIVTESMESFHQFFVNKLSEIKGIGQTKSVFVMDVIKETHEVL